MPADAEVKGGAVGGPVLGVQIDALECEIVRIGEVRKTSVERRRRTRTSNEVELLPRGQISGIECQRAILLGERGIVPSVPPVDLAEVVVGAGRDIGVEPRARIAR